MRYIPTCIHGIKEDTEAMPDGGSGFITNGGGSGGIGHGGGSAGIHSGSQEI